MDLKPWLPNWLESFLPAPTGLLPRQRLITAAGAFVGIGIAAVFCGVLHTWSSSAWWLMAPLGASAAQVFSVPASPMSQPWPVVAGHALSALSGLIAFHLFGYSSLAAAVAVGLAVALMLQVRALHPSGGGTALLMVMSQTGDWHFILFPVLANSVVLVLTALVWHRFSGHTYPHRQRFEGSRSLALYRFDASDLEHALRQQGEILDISRDDIRRVIEATEMNAYRRLTGGKTCADIMTAPVHAVHFGTHLKEVWSLMLRHDIKALPVIDRRRFVRGLVTRAGIEAEAARHGGLKAFLASDGRSHSDIPEVAGQLMQEDVVTAAQDDPADRLMSLFSRSEQRHIVILDHERRLAGIISVSDMIRALYHATP